MRNPWYAPPAFTPFEAQLPPESTDVRQFLGFDGPVGGDPAQGVMLLAASRSTRQTLIVETRSDAHPGEDRRWLVLAQLRDLAQLPFTDEARQDLATLATTGPWEPVPVIVDGHRLTGHRCAMTDRLWCLTGHHAGLDITILAAGPRQPEPHLLPVTDWKPYGIDLTSPQPLEAITAASKGFKALA